MKFKLDDIDKQHPYQVPEQYFDELTTNIQRKIGSKQPSQIKPYIRFAWALPAVALLIAFSWWISFQSANTDAESLLADVSDEQIILYLENSDLSIAELVNMTDRPEELVDSPDYLEGIELEDENLEDLMNAFDLNESYL